MQSGLASMLDFSGTLALYWPAKKRRGAINPHILPSIKVMMSVSPDQCDGRMLTQMRYRRWPVFSHSTDDIRLSLLRDVDGHMTYLAGWIYGTTIQVLPFRLDDLSQYDVVDNASNPSTQSLRYKHLVSTLN
jgi:hypothetical protein